MMIGGSSLWPSGTVNETLRFLRGAEEWDGLRFDASSPELDPRDKLLWKRTSPGDWLKNCELFFSKDSFQFVCIEDANRLRLVSFIAGLPASLSATCAGVVNVKD